MAHLPLFVRVLLSILAMAIFAAVLIAARQSVIYGLVPIWFIWFIWLGGGVMLGLVYLAFWKRAR